MSIWENGINLYDFKEKRNYESGKGVSFELLILKGKLENCIYMYNSSGDQFQDQELL